MSIPVRKNEAPASILSQTATVEDLRLVQRVLARWQNACQTQEFPRRSDIEAEAFGEDWAHCFVLDRTGNHPFPVFETLGDELAKYSGIFLSGASDWSQTLLDKATAHVGEVHTTHDGVLLEEALERYDGERLAFRCILLPLSEDGANITHILGAANGRLLGEKI